MANEIDANTTSQLRLDILKQKLGNTGEQPTENHAVENRNADPAQLTYPWLI